MKCPACDHSLSEITVTEITVDVCRDGCHGLWLDPFELDKIDEPHESAGEALLDFSPPPPTPTDAAARRACPRCAGVLMQRHFFSVRREVEIDDCPGCGGVWLDAGELARLRAEFTTADARRQAAERIFVKLFGQDLAAQAIHSQEQADRAHKFARAFKYVLPSYWIPGKQKGGAF